MDNNQPKEQGNSVSITEAAKLNNVSRQAIYVAIKLRKLKATKDATRWNIHLDDLEDYRKHKYSRSKSRFNGELLFDHSKGHYSISQAARFLGVPVQKLYYATRTGALKGQRKGAAWVLMKEDLKNYAEGYLRKGDSHFHATA